MGRISRSCRVICQVWFGSLLLLLLHAPNSRTFAAEVIGDLDHLRLEGKDYLGFVEEVFSPDEGTFAILTTLGVIEVDLNFNQLRSYRFDYRYDRYVSTVRVNGELHILGQRELLGFFRPPNNDVHLVRYGERAPVKIWECRWCSRPDSAYLLDYKNPVVAWRKVRGFLFPKRETLRLMQLGTNREWSLEAPGHRICSHDRTVIGYKDETKGLQDISYNLERITNVAPGLDYHCKNPYKTVRLSQVNLDDPKSLNDYDGVTEGSGLGAAPPGYQDDDYFQYKLRHIDRKENSAIIEIQDFRAIDYRLRLPAPVKHTWKVEFPRQLHYLRNLVKPEQLDCKSEDGTKFDSYLVLLEDSYRCGGRPCRDRIYELRPGGKWRVAFENNLTTMKRTTIFDQPLMPLSFSFFVLARDDRIYVGLAQWVVRLDRGSDFCSTDLSDFEDSLPSVESVTQ